MWRLRAPLLALLLMQVILLASSGVTATKKPLGKQETCNMKNHMIEYLRNNGVQIYERPQIDSVICQKEWRSFGTCCEQSSIKSAIAKKIQLNNHALTRLAQEFQLVVPGVKDYYQKYMTSPDSERKSQQNSRMGNGISFMTKHRHLYQLYEKLLSDLESLVSKEMIQHQTECVNKLNEIISKSACSICSGRSDDFFSSDGRLAISEPTCRVVLRACNTAWTNMVKVAEAVRSTTQYVRTISGIHNRRAECSDLEELGFTMNLDSFITNRNLIPIMKKCGSDLANCSFEHVAALCEQFIHIQAPTYIESSQSQIMRIKSKFDSARRSFEAVRKELKLSTSVLESIPNFSLQSTRNLAKGVTSLEAIEKHIMQISLIHVQLQMESAKFQKLSAERDLRSQEILKKTNRLIEEIQQTIKEYLLVKHSHLVRITLATKPAEATLRKLDVLKGLDQRVIPNANYSKEIQNLRTSIEGLWSDIHFDLERKKILKEDMYKKFGKLIHGSKSKWKYVQDQDRMTVDLLQQLYKRVYEDIVQPLQTSPKKHVLNQQDVKKTVKTPQQRGLSLLFGSVEDYQNCFTMETIVVRDDSTSLDIEEQWAGVVPFLTTP